MEIATTTKPKAVVSGHVCSMKSSAQLVAALFVQLGFDVWVCYDVSGGEEYKQEIERNIENADVVVMLLNNHWALSDQCKHELKFAQQLKFPQPNKHTYKKPVLLSIAFTDLAWHPIFLLSTDLICHDTPSLLTGNTQRTLDLLKQTAVVQLHTKRVLIKGNRGTEYEVEAFSDSQGEAQMRIRNLKTGILVPEDQYEISVGPGSNGTVRRLIKFRKVKEGEDRPSEQQEEQQQEQQQEQQASTPRSSASTDSEDETTSLDKEKATELYESVFGAEQPHAICRLAQCYLDGNAVIEKNPARALKLYEKAAEKGSTDAAYAAGYLYEKDKRIPQDLDKAAALYSKAAAAGHSLAKKRIQKVLTKKWKRDHEESLPQQGVVDEKLLLSMLSVIRIM